MKLTKAQLEYIKTRRDELNKSELELRRLGEEVLYGNEDRSYVKKLYQIFKERDFFNFMIDMHNVVIKEERCAE